MSQPKKASVLEIAYRLALPEDSQAISDLLLAAFGEFKSEYMYVVHVVDDTCDYYLLVRIDDLKRGERLVLSYKKLVLP